MYVLVFTKFSMICRRWDHLFTMKKISDCVASVEKIAPIKEKSPDKEKVRVRFCSSNHWSSKQIG